MSFLSVINDVCISPNIVNNECFNGDVTEFLDSFANICPITQKLYLYKLGIGVFPTAILDKNRSLFFEADKLIDAINCCCSKHQFVILNELYAKERQAEITNIQGLLDDNEGEDSNEQHL